MQTTRADVKNFSFQIKSGAEIPVITKKWETRESYRALDENGRRFDHYKSTTIDQERANFTMGRTTYSCLNTPDAIAALADRLAKPLGALGTYSATKAAIKPYTIPKPAAFSWTTAASFLTEENSTPANNIENYKNYLALYNLTPAYAANNKPGLTLILTHLEPYQSKAIPTFTGLYTGRLVQLSESGKITHNKPALHHLRTGILVVDEHIKNPEDKLKTLTGERMVAAMDKLSKAEPLNPSVDVSTPGKFTNLNYLIIKAITNQAA